MCVWKQGGIVLKKMGGREHMGMPRPILSETERTTKTRSLRNKRKFKAMRGKKTYQPTPKKFH